MNEQSAKIFVSVVTFNNALTISSCLESILAETDLELSVFVTDNASSDATARIIRERFSSRLNFIENELNLGFSKAHNNILRLALEAQAEQILFFNPDARLLPGALKILSRSLQEDGEAGTATPKLLRAEGADITISQPERIDAAGMYFTKSFRHFDRGSDEPAAVRFNRSEYVIGGTGACLLIKRQCAQDVIYSRPGLWPAELFDNTFFAYREDAELALRLTRLGWKCLYEPQAVVLHCRKVLPENRGQVESELNAYSVRNRFLLQFNHGLSLRTLLSTLLRNLLVIGAVLLKERSSLPALRAAFSLQAVAHRSRACLEKKAKVSRKDLEPWFKNSPQALPRLVVAERSAEQTIQVVIVNYNSGSRLHDCLAYLLGSSGWERAGISVCVWDNNSEDQSLTLLKSSFAGNPRVVIERSRENLGFGAAINQALKEKQQSAFLILNPDIKISAETIERLAESLSRFQELAAVAPLLIDSRTDEPQLTYCYRALPSLGSTLAEVFYLHRLWPNNPWTRSYLLKDRKLPAYGSLELVPQPAAAALLVRAEDFRNLSGFDEQFKPAWFEDVDFLKRIQESGRLVALDTSARAIHEGGYSVKQLSQSHFAEIWYGNLLKYWKKHGSKTEQLTLRFLLPLGLCLRAAVALLEGLFQLRPEENKNKSPLCYSRSLLKLAKIAAFS